jgi:MFS family permease
VGIYNQEIEPFTNAYEFTIELRTAAQTLNPVAAIIGSIYIGRLLDKYKCFKLAQILVALAMSIGILLTFLFLHFDVSDYMVLLVAICMGVPTTVISVISFQFISEVSYPVAEYQVISLLSMFNKFFSLGFAKLNTAFTDPERMPDNTGYMYGFILWIFMPLIGLIPAFLVEEDLRRLNLKEVKQSEYVEETELLTKTEIERTDFAKTHKIIANPIVLEELFLINPVDPKHKSERMTYSVERMTTTKDDEKIYRRTGRQSDDINLRYNISRASSYKK